MMAKCVKVDAVQFNLSPARAHRPTASFDFNLHVSPSMSLQPAYDNTIDPVQDNRRDAGDSKKM